MIVRRVGNLAAEITSFVGRDDEVVAGAAMLAEGRLLTVAGPAGVGKSRTALRIAMALRRSCPDGLWHVELSRVAAVRSAAEGEAALVEAVARALALDGGVSSARDLAAALRERRALLLLDTCDHLIGPVVRLAEHVLAAAPRMHILATGRRAIPVGEVLRLRPLPLTDPAAPDPASPSVVLFADRAVAVDPDFRLTGEVLPAVAEICRRVDGLPLAIELAAARTRSLSPGELLAMMDGGFSVLSGVGAAFPSRHRDLRAAVAWSYNLCEKRQRALWDVLAAVKGPFDLAAAERAAAQAGPADDVADVLAELVERSILLREPTPSHYRMPDVYRWFALERYGATGSWTGAPAGAVTTHAEGPSGDGARAGHPLDHALTPRELQVAELIAEGLSNAQIARNLQIAKRTVDAHVRNILAKGRLVSRTQIAAWVAEREHRPDAFSGKEPDV